MGVTGNQPQGSDNGLRSSPSGLDNGVLAMVLKGFPRISETFISNEIQLLEEAGLRIHIFSMRSPREGFSHASVSRIKAPVTYLPESLFWGLPRLMAANARLAASAPRAYRSGLRLMLSRHAGTPKQHTWLKHFLQAGYMLQAIRSHAAHDPGHAPVAHIHAHFAHSPSSVALYAAEMAGLPFSFTAHAKDIYTQDPDRLRAKMARAGFVVTCTRYNERHLRQLRGVSPSPPIHTIYHGIDLSLFTPPARDVRPRPPYTILTVARMVPKKGLPTVLHALRLLRDQGLEFTYTLVGDGPRRGAILALVRELALTDQVRLIGTIPHEKVLGLYAQADLFVLGCRQAEDGDRDGIPNVVAEAMAMHVPVAATRISGLPELVEQEHTGLLAPSDDPPALAAHMRRLLTDEALRAEIIPAARARVEAVFDNRLLARELARIFLCAPAKQP